MILESAESIHYYNAGQGSLFFKNASIYKLESTIFTTLTKI